MNLLIAGNCPLSNENCEYLRKLGYAITFSEREDCLTIENANQYDVVICNYLFARHDIHSFTKLKAVQLLSTGLDRIPMDYVLAKNITVWNAQGVYSIPIAEFTVMAVLDLYKHSDFFYDNQQEHRWLKCRNIDELSDKTVCILGTGHIGTEMAKKFSVFAKKIIGLNRHKRQVPYFTEIRDSNNIKATLNDSDVVIITLPLQEDTYHMFNAELLNAMKGDAVLVNVGRGAVIDEIALQDALLNGKFRGVILDVFEHEPLPENHWAWNVERIRIIPHNTFESKKNSERINKQVMNNLESYIRTPPALHNIYK